MPILTTGEIHFGTNRKQRKKHYDLKVKYRATNKEKNQRIYYDKCTKIYINPNKYTINSCKSLSKKEEEQNEEKTKM